MLLSDVLKMGQAALVTITPETPLVEAARMLRDNSIGVLIAIDNDGNPAGILSERDISRAVADHCGDERSGLADARTGDYMSANVVVCEITEQPQTAIWLMAEYGIRHLPITSRGKLQGMVSSRDVMKVIADMPVFEAEDQSSLAAAVTL